MIFFEKLRGKEYAKEKNNTGKPVLK
jgi:hypothetical protein